MLTFILWSVVVVIVLMVLVVIACCLNDRSYDSCTPAKKVIPPTEDEEEQKRRIEYTIKTSLMIAFVSPMFLLHPAAAVMAWPAAAALAAIAGLLTWVSTFSFVTSCVIVYAAFVCIIVRIEMVKEFGVEVKRT